MKKLIFLLISGCFFIQCKKNDAVEIVDVKKSVDLNIERFDKLYAKATVKTLPDLKNQYPFLFPKQFPDSIWYAKISDPIFKELNVEVEKQFPDNKKFEDGLEMMVSRVKHYFPDEKTPRVITLVNEVLIDKKAFYTNDLILISLDTYLGKNHKFYEPFAEYQKANLEPNQILPDLVTNFAFRKIVPSQDKTLISEMIYFGKLHYLKDLLIPEVPNYQKIGYTEMQEKFCIENESQMWSYLVNEKLLYDNNIKNYQRFIEDGPFTKFYLDIDRESPGRVGQWLGWQIVKSYIENNDVTLDELLKTEPTVIFNKSGYKPKK
ncbi:gliding motility lipoprotein GldB [Flavobacterium terrigena]|uniref:Gliding motility-associated lipoprotein GldB n=1 Tax=Flavobacterium terrigena TaxID=402734 RepID=A0A1H6WWC3_9FLAO|nr:gliding motility lipoprotein GldB [Flavobacterium terrigena]SEJ21221.1 gliding motility-associated lipoprotein GldB [Flavobacterium terrigena]